MTEYSDTQNLMTCKQWNTVPAKINGSHYFNKEKNTYSIIKNDKDDKG